MDKIDPVDKFDIYNINKGQEGAGWVSGSYLECGLPLSCQRHTKHEMEKKCVYIYIYIYFFPSHVCYKSHLGARTCFKITLYAKKKKKKKTILTTYFVGGNAVCFSVEFSLFLIIYFANIWWTLKLFPFRFNHRPGPLRFIEEKHYFFGEQSSVLGRASKEGLFFFLPGDHR